MVSEPVKDRLKEAGMYLDQAEKMGDNPAVISSCVACDGLLENIKVFIQGKHEEAWVKIAEKEKELATMFNEMFKKETNKIQNLEEYHKYIAQQKIEGKLLKWKCRQRLSFYDWVSQKYDI